MIYNPQEKLSYKTQTKINNTTNNLKSDTVLRCCNSADCLNKKEWGPHRRQYVTNKRHDWIHTKPKS